jgi:hypothetical protein
MMPRLALFLGALVLATPACSTPAAPASDVGLDVAIALDAPTSSDGAMAGDTPAPLDAPSSSDVPSASDGAVALDATDAPSTADAGTADAPSVDAARDAPSDAGLLPDARCAPYCDPISGSYFTCVDGLPVCMCGPCSGDPLACC